MGTREIVDVEDALRGHVPPGGFEAVERLVRRGRLLVRLAQGLRVTHDEAEQMLEAVRTRDI
ncbi:MAG: hypothetical protein ACRYG6_15955 [Janthinobacterium lividum]